ncbi:MAG TPA: spherulation-specific family 4 protein [Kineosporiaceae bacterium]|nr:spherulation-specific family 4 protein [Kineosporiaceae bacterium]
MTDASIRRVSDQEDGRTATLGRRPTGKEAARIKVDLAVPAYVHPLIDPDVWERLATVARHLRFVIVNVDSGPGALLDPAYPPVIEQLRASRARLVGYVDTDYGRRSVEDVVADARLWVLRYGVRGVFFDQVAGDFEHLEYYAACALGARACGAQYVVLNPGADCHPGYADIANVTVTFEGTWTEYADHEPPRWTLGMPASRFCHLVYDVPADRIAAGPAKAAGRHAGTAFFTGGGGANPWDQLPAAVVDAVRRAHPGAVTPSVGTPSWGGRSYAEAPADSSRAPADSSREGPPPVAQRTPAPVRAGRPLLWRRTAVPDPASGKS